MPLVTSSEKHMLTPGSSPPSEKKKKARQGESLIHSEPGARLSYTKSLIMMERE
jgi:hypothetical protein